MNVVHQQSTTELILIKQKIHLSSKNTLQHDIVSNHFVEEAYARVQLSEIDYSRYPDNSFEVVP